MPIVEIAHGATLPTAAPIAIIHPVDRDPWVLSAGFSGLGQLCGSPSPDRLCVVERNARVVLIDVQTLEQQQFPGLDPVHIAAALDHGLLLIAGPTTITAIGDDGIRWTSAPLVGDDLHITRSDGDRIYFRGVDSNYTDQVRGSLDTATGEVIP